MWILTDTLIERLTFCVYGKAIQMIDIQGSSKYEIMASRLDYDDDNLLAAIEMGLSHKLILASYCKTYVQKA